MASRRPGTGVPLGFLNSTISAVMGFRLSRMSAFLRKRLVEVYSTRRPASRRPIPGGHADGPVPGPDPGPGTPPRALAATFITPEAALITLSLMRCTPAECYRVFSASLRQFLYSSLC